MKEEEAEAPADGPELVLPADEEGEKEDEDEATTSSSCCCSNLATSAFDI